ncbi:MAG: ribbon-helix-helix domain-containing protein [Actinomycetota bacterium]|nr:ribbon-helix-helix domain-containing protein [Actinomycetota bacterium]MDP2288892.1 ribbon-helix-helix domain-containing protein [Actinomycetota bacterium]
MADEKIDGVPVTEAMIEAWAKEAEAGYPVERLRKRGRKPAGDGPGSVVPVRMDAALLQALDKCADREHISRSEAIRAAVRAWIDSA